MNQDNIVNAGNAVAAVAQGGHRSRGVLRVYLAMLSVHNEDRTRHFVIDAGGTIWELIDGRYYECAAGQAPVEIVELAIHSEAYAEELEYLLRHFNRDLVAFRTPCVREMLRNHTRDTISAREYVQRAALLCDVFPVLPGRRGFPECQSLADESGPAGRRCPRRRCPRFPRQQ